MLPSQNIGSEERNEYGTFLHHQQQNKSNLLGKSSRLALFSFAFFGFCAFFLLSTESPQQQQQLNEELVSLKKNIVIFLVDDMGFNDVGYQSSDLFFTTPSIDKFAQKSIYIRQHYAQPSCTPTRSALLTGFYPIHTGMQHYGIQGNAPWGLPLGFKILPQYLAEYGYESHVIGKWNQGHHTENFLPHRRGFNSFYGFVSDGEDYYDYKYSLRVCDSDHHCSKFRDFMRSTNEGTYEYLIDPGFNGTYSGFLHRDAALDVIHGHDPNNPLFLYMAFQAVHSPIDDIDSSYFKEEELKFLDSYIFNSDRKLFGKMLITLDKTFQSIIDALDQNGMLENTVIAFFSDNGGCSNQGGNNYPFTGQKFDLFEGGIRTPAFIYDFSLSQSFPATDYNEIFHVTDWLPTLFHAAIGQQFPYLDTIDGVDHWPQLSGLNDESPRNEILINIDRYETYDNQFGLPPKILDATEMVAAIRVKDWKYLMNQYNNSPIDPVSPSLESCQSTKNREKRDYLFDLSVDPLEQLNVIDQFPEIANDLKNMILKYLETETFTAWQGTDTFAKESFDKTGCVGPWLDENGQYLYSDLRR